MDQVITIKIDAEPIGQPRPQVSMRGGVPRAYVPAKHGSHALKEVIKLQAKQAMAGHDLMTGPVAVSVMMCFSRPKSHTKKQRQCNWHCNKPDVDNALKLIFDAVNGIIWHDDSQICRIDLCEKKWAEQGSIVLSVEALQ